MTDEQKAIAREKRMMDSGKYEEIDWSFLDEILSDFPDMLKEVKEALDRPNSWPIQPTSFPIEQPDCSPH